MAINIPGKAQLTKLLDRLKAKRNPSRAPAHRHQVYEGGTMAIMKAPLPTKFLGVSILVLVIALFFLFHVSGKLVRATDVFKAVKLEAPNIKEYLPTLVMESKKILADGEQDVTDEIESKNNKELASGIDVDKNIALNKTFEYLGRFENNRAKKTLLAIKPVVAGVEQGGYADVAGIQTGDVIVKVDGNPIESVMGYYLAASQRPSMEIILEVERGGKPKSFTLSSPKSQMINSNNTGLMFVIPANMNYVTKEDSLKFAAEYKQNFLSSIPLEWQDQFASNLMYLSQRISSESNVLAISVQTSNPLSKMKTSDFLLWQHEQFSKKLDEFYAHRRQSEAEVVMTLSSVGDALTGLAAGFFLFICAFLYYLFAFKQQNRI